MSRPHEHVAKVLQAEWHRNGIGGAGFYAVLFQPEKGYNVPLMLAVVFDEPHHCAVLAVAPLSGEGGVTFGTNSWRGDNFEPELRAAIKAGEGQDNPGAVRVGPFGIPSPEVIAKAFAEHTKGGAK